MDKDYIWEAEYGRRNHLREILKELVRKQQAEALQMVALCVNNIPYNLELYIVVSYDRPQKEDIEEMQELFEGRAVVSTGFNNDRTFKRNGEIDDLIAIQF